MNNYLHAEMMAIINAKDLDIEWSKCYLFVYRRNKLNCRPCNACMKIIKDIGIKNIFYTDNNEYVYERIW